MYASKEKKGRFENHVSLDHHGDSIDRTSERRADDGRLPESTCPACLPACLRAAAAALRTERCCSAAAMHACMHARAEAQSGRCQMFLPVGMLHQATAAAAVG